MSYATISDLRQWIDEATLIQLTDDDDAGSTNEAVVAAVLESASVEIDGYVGGRYSLPFATPPAILAKLCVDIAGWLLYVRRDAGAPDHWQKRYDNAIAFLTKVSTGALKLGAGDPQGTGSGGVVTVTAPDAEFSSDKLVTY
jgi:phage gp36-like protein